MLIKVNKHLLNILFNAKAKEFKIFALLLCALTYSPLPSIAERGEVISNKTKVTFLGNSNFHSFRGKIEKLSGFIYGDSKDVKSINYLQLEFDPLSFVTKNIARDENLKRMFQVDSNPIITFRSTNVLVSHDKAYADITGRLTINRITRRINFTAHLNKYGKKGIRAKGKFTIKLSDFKLRPPAPAFIRVNNLVNVEFNAVASWYN
ncbi:MAG: YceI family protein [Candidatus Caenarcaniphilales bacterium]|nr:YceI family protein [Candidatus Caenarcaniphilales bacterium]